MPAAPSVLFDAVVIAASPHGADQLLRELAALDFIGDAFAHLKVIGYVEGALPLLRAAGIDDDKHDDGVLPVAKTGKPADFVATASKGRVWTASLGSA